jgi:hypothetical protein
MHVPYCLGAQSHVFRPIRILFLTRIFFYKGLLSANTVERHAISAFAA